MHNNTIFPVLHLLFIEVAQSFSGAGNFVPLNCQKIKKKQFFKKKSKTTIKSPSDRLCIPEALFTSLDKYLTCYTYKS